MHRKAHLTEREICLYDNLNVVRMPLLAEGWRVRSYVVVLKAISGQHTHIPPHPLNHDAR